MNENLVLTCRNSSALTARGETSDSVYKLCRFRQNIASIFTGLIVLKSTETGAVLQNILSDKRISAALNAVPVSI